MAPGEDGFIRAPSSELDGTCNAPLAAQDASLPGNQPLSPGESLASVKTVRVTSATLQPVEAQVYQNSCDPSTSDAAIPRPPEVLPYVRTTPVLVGTIPGSVQSLPAAVASSDPAALSCLPTRPVDSRQTAELLGDYAYLLTPHPDRGCGYAEMLEKAEETVERDARYDVTFGSPLTTPERFAFDDGAKPDECQQFTVGTAEIARERLERIGTFPESTPPAECATNRCVREFAGLLGSSAPTSPSVDLTRAAAEAKLAYHAYLPSRDVDDLNVSITPPTGTGEDADTFSVSTRLAVPLSFNRQSTIVHVAHGKPEVDGD